MYSEHSQSGKSISPPNREMQKPKKQRINVIRGHKENMIFINYRKRQLTKIKL